MPPTLILTASQDSLRFDGLRFNDLLKKFGVSTQHVELEGAQHGFLEMGMRGALDQCWWMSKKKRTVQKQCCEKAFQIICDYLKEEE